MNGAVGLQSGTPLLIDKPELLLAQIEHGLPKAEAYNAPMYIMAGVGQSGRSIRRRSCRLKIKTAR
jgi:hypothetical protein